MVINTNRAYKDKYIPTGLFIWDDITVIKGACVIFYKNKNNFFYYDVYSMNFVSLWYADIVLSYGR